MPARRQHFDKSILHPGVVVRLAEADGAHTLVGETIVRVPGGVPGDRGLVRIRHVGGQAAWGSLELLEHPSPDRVEAPCPVVLRCGGCPWQTASLQAQRAARLAAIQGLLGDLAADARWHLWPGTAATTGYRTRALMMARKNRRLGLELGFFAPGSHDLVPATGCVVQHPLVTQVLTAARDVLEASHITVWNDETATGLLRAVLYRVDPDLGEGLLTLVVSRHARQEQLAAELLEIPGVSGVFVNTNAAPGGAVLGPETLHVGGERTQRVRYGSLDLEVGPTAFLQTRHDMTATLIDVVGGFLPARMAHLLDLYAGVGVLGLSLRERADRLTLVERDAEAVLDARVNLANLGVTAGRVVAADAAIFAGDLAGLDPPPDAVVLDPPRAGCAPAVLDAVAALPGNPALVYVSCGPASLARDLKRLREAGFQVTDVALLDMFVHTPHVEVVVALRRGA